MPISQLWGKKKSENFFRKAFFLKQAPEKAILRIFVDTGYELFLNGRFVAYANEWNNVRDYNVRVFLREGINQIAVHGVNSAGHRGFAFALNVNGEKTVVSDGSWKVSDREQWGWMLSDFKDDSWPFADVMDMSCAGIGQWKGMPGDYPERVIPVLNSSPFFLGEVTKAVDSPFFQKPPNIWTPSQEVLAVLGSEYAESSAAFPPAIANSPLILEIHSDNGEISETDGTFSVQAPARWEGPWLMLDFQAENVGFFRMRFQGEGTVYFRITYGETVPECMNPPASDTLAYRMLVEEGMVREGVQEWESRMLVGFRFAKVEFFHSSKIFEIGGFSIRNSLYPVAYKGFFSCADKLLNRIWSVGRKTVHLCMQEYYWDAVKRDRLLWVDDTYLMARYNYFLFGDTELFKFCWREIASCRYADGAIPSAMGEGASLLWDYVGCWLAAFHDYYVYTGDASFPLSLKQEIYDATDWLATHAGGNALISIPQNPLNVWMVTLNRQPGHDPYMNELYRRSLETALCIAELAGDDERVRLYEQNYERTSAAVRELRSKRPFRGEKCMYSHMPELNEILQEYFEDGLASQAVELMRKEWGGYVLGSGMDTFMETLYRPGGYPSVLDPMPPHPYGHTSLCHGWAASPCEFLVSKIAGIKPLLPGFRRFEVSPDAIAPVPLKAVMPTPYGEVAILLEEKKAVIVVPSGTTGVFLGKELSPGTHEISTQ